MFLTPWSLTPESWPGPLLLVRGIVSVGQADLAAETRACQAPEVRSLLLAWPVSDPAVRVPLGLEHTRLR